MADTQAPDAPAVDTVQDDFNRRVSAAAVTLGYAEKEGDTNPHDAFLQRLEFATYSFQCAKNQADRDHWQNIGLLYLLAIRL